MEKITMIKVENVSKKFKIGFKKNQSVLERFVSFVSGKESKKIIEVLKNISFEVEAGKIIGVIGKNGSGKTTLLRTIAGIYKQDSGIIKTNGKIICLINLGSGMNPRLTMRENIYLICSFFDLSQSQIKQRFNSIVKFSELDDFINTKLYQFSSGMIQRLSFSIAIHCDPEIFLLDEIFEVGDESFRNKSSNKIKELVKKGATVLLVSHNLDLIKKHCDKIILMNKGKIIKSGKITEVIKYYLKDI